MASNSGLKDNQWEYRIFGQICTIYMGRLKEDMGEAIRIPIGRRFPSWDDTTRLTKQIISYVAWICSRDLE